MCLQFLKYGADLRVMDANLPSQGANWSEKTVRWWKRWLDWNTDQGHYSSSFSFPVFPLNAVSAHGIGSPESYLTIVCAYHPTGWNQETGPSFLALLTSLFDNHIGLILVSEINAKHVNWDGFSCCGPCTSFKTKIVTLVQDSLTFQHVIGPTRHRCDAPPTLFGSIFT